MRKDEFFEQQYIINDAAYLKYYCTNEAEAYEIEKGLSYNDNLWLFNKPSDGLEDCYDEESEP